MEYNCFCFIRGIVRYYTVLEDCNDEDFFVDMNAGEPITTIQELFTFIGLLKGKEIIDEKILVFLMDQAKEIERGQKWTGHKY